MGNQVSSLAFKIQVSDLPIGGVRPEMSTEDFIDATTERLESVGAVVAEAIEPFFNQLAGLKSKPLECAIEFGVNVGGEAGVPFVTKGTVGANFKISLKWNWGVSK